MPSPHEAKFKVIKELLKKSPDMEIGAACKKYGVPYRSYYNWLRKINAGDPLQGGSKTNKAPTIKQSPAMPKKPLFPHDKEKDVVTVDIPLSEVVEMVKNQRPNLVIPRDRVISCMAPSEVDEVDRIIGRAARERLSQVNHNNTTHPVKTVFDAVNGDDEENGS